MKRLKMATTFFPQVLIIDGLDQLSDDDNAHEIRWLPKILPEYVKVILSVRSDSSSPALRSLRVKVDVIDYDIIANLFFNYLFFISIYLILMPICMSASVTIYVDNISQ